PALAGATAATLRAIQVIGGGTGRDALVLDSQKLAGRLRVRSDGDIVVGGSVTVGALSLVGANVTITGKVSAATVDLNSPGRINVDSGGVVQARNGGAVRLSGQVVVLAGQVSADGIRGGKVLVSATNVLHSGTVTANGLRGPGGLVSVAFT